MVNTAHYWVTPWEGNTPTYHRYEPLVELVIHPSEIYVSEDSTHWTDIMKLWPVSRGLLIELWTFQHVFILWVRGIKQKNNFLTSVYFTYHESTRRINNTRGCNGAMDWVPGGVVRIIGLASESVLVVWTHRWTVWPSVRTYYYSVWMHGQTILLHTPKNGEELIRQT